MNNFIKQIREIDPKLLDTQVPIICPDCGAVFYRRIQSRNWACGKCRKNINRDFIRTATLDYLRSKNYDVGIDNSSKDRYIQTIIVKYLDIISLMRNNDISVVDLKFAIKREMERRETILDLLGED